MDAVVERASTRGIVGPALREPNAIDFWRGFALLTIFINHVPGNAFEPFTYSHFSISDAAELFVFLAGWAIALAVRVVLEWHNAGPVFADPVPTTIGWVLLTHQL